MDEKDPKCVDELPAFPNLSRADRFLQAYEPKKPSKMHMMMPKRPTPLLSSGMTDTYQKPVVKKPVANHFFAIRVNDAQIIQGVEAVQRSILEQQPLLKTALVNPNSFHITLAVLSINSQEELIKAQSVLAQSGQVFSEYLKSRPVHIHFGQVDHFASKQVVYAGVKDDDEGLSHLMSLSKVVRGRCLSNGITLVDGDRFTPHLTLLKLSKDPKLRKKGIKSVERELFESYTHTSFGKQVVDSIQLLSMHDPKDEEGYYAKIDEFYFEKQSTSMGEESKCSPSFLQEPPE